MISAFSKSFWKSRDIVAYVKLVHAGHFPRHVRHHVLAMFKRSDIMSDEVSHIKTAHAGHFQFYVRHVPRGPHIWRTLWYRFQNNGNFQVFLYILDVFCYYHGVIIKTFTENVKKHQKIAQKHAATLTLSHMVISRVCTCLEKFLNRCRVLQKFLDEHTWEKYLYSSLDIAKSYWNYLHFFNYVYMAIVYLASKESFGLWHVLFQARNWT